ncbi:MAG TPA: hypothetical protein VFJ43_11030, partial [Bacteroidia bacterium]|nr:hypothetical protein [Bacteroidia bacterium]
FLTVVATFSLPLFSYAQCSMCRAVAESGTKNGQTVAGGLNYAILYLMVIPYLLLLFFFRKKIWEFLKGLKSMKSE